MISMPLELVLFALAYVILTVIVQQKFSNVKRIREIAREMKQHQEDLKKKGQTMTTEEMNEKQKVMMSLTSEMMRHQLRASFVILPVSLLLFYFVLPYFFGSPSTTITVLSFTMPYRTFFIIVALILGIISQRIVTEYDRKQAEKAAAKLITNNA